MDWRLATGDCRGRGTDRETGNGKSASFRAQRRRCGGEESPSSRERASVPSSQFPVPRSPFPVPSPQSDSLYFGVPSSPLPIHAVLPDLAAALGRGTSAVLQAPPGAGKTTGVPPALLDAPWLTGKKIMMLEPRRLAARAAARRMSQLLGQGVGGTAGFRVRGETRVSGLTRIEVVTEGILTRMLQSDPSLDDVGLVIFDEFHERSLDADLALALTLETRDVLRPDLRVLVMSATLDGASVARLLGDAAVITS